MTSVARQPAINTKPGHPLSGTLGPPQGLGTGGFSAEFGSENGGGFRSMSRVSTLDDQMKDNLAKLQLKLLQQKLQTRQKPRTVPTRTVPTSADMRLRTAMKDREKLLAELRMEKLKEESMAADNGLQRPYLSTDEYPPYTGIPGTYPAMPYSSVGASRHLDGLEHGLSLDKRYNFGDLALQSSLLPVDRFQARSRSVAHPFRTTPSFPPPPPSFAPYHMYGGGSGYQMPQQSKTSEMMEMMMMQNAQMNQAIMQQMMMSSMASKTNNRNQNSQSSPEVRFLPAPGAAGGMVPPGMGFPGPNSNFKLPALFSGQMPNSSTFSHPAQGPGDFPTEAAPFTVEP